MHKNDSGLSLIDLISEKHAQLRKWVEQRWEQQSDLHFSHNEWYLLAKVEQAQMSISQAATILDISRQAMQKMVRKLEEQGYLYAEFREGNKRDKYLSLSAAGKARCAESNALKSQLEQELKDWLGAHDFQLVKALFEKEWGVGESE